MIHRVDVMLTEELSLLLNLCNNYMYRNVRMSDNIFSKERESKLECQFEPIFNSRINEVQFYEVISSCSLGLNCYAESIDEFSIKKMCIKRVLSYRKLGVTGFISFKVDLSYLLDCFFVKELMLFSELNIAIEVCNFKKNINFDLIGHNIILLQKSGVMVWLADYHKNSEQANLYFGKINWDMIKIGASFLSHNDFDAIEALYYVLKPFTRYGLIFEGVDTSNQAKMIKSIGEFGQGKFYL